MKSGRPLGLDELMIVNPGQRGGEALFLGEDGTLYQVQGLGGENEPKGLGQFFLGEDGALYQVQGFEGGGPVAAGEGSGEVLGGELGHYFLGADGTLYEVVAK